ncbi:MAG: L-fucose/L-arabinose isomerase family protein [Candidatus Sumerlaeaceae bacterium]|nr:L-fucose/L-arabinose isomerase family protein [Candidatus Sumerlaeaceae bacterium]
MDKKKTVASKRGIRVGILSFGDGRSFLQEPLKEVNARFLQALAQRLQDDGFDVVTGSEVVWQNDIAVREGRRMAAEAVDAVIFNFSVWAWPQYARVAAQFCPQPILMFSNVNPQYPGLVGMLANAGSLDQVGIKFYKTFGDIADDAVLARVRTNLLAIAAANRLRGMTYALIGGRSLGIDTAVADPALWMEKFGIDVDHIDQMELVRRADNELVSKSSRIPAALEYLKKHLRKIHWTPPDAAMRLTEELLRRQLGMYYAARDLCAEFKYDFCGIKGQRELTEHYATADVAEAFLNDPYGPEGEPHEPIVCSTEADMDAALTMQVFKLLAATPVLFADVRHYHADLGVWDLCNSGEHATYFAAKSFDPVENLAKTEFRPEGFYFPAGGAAVYHIAAPGRVTLARLTRSGATNRYRMAIVPGEFVTFGAARDEELACSVQDNWPHAFAKFDCAPEDFINGFHCNHIHGVYGDWVEELIAFCDIKGIDWELLG